MRASLASRKSCFLYVFSECLIVAGSDKVSPIFVYDWNKLFTVDLVVTAVVSVGLMRSCACFICKLNVGLITQKYDGTMWRNIGWIEVSKSSEKSSNSIQFVERLGVQRALKRVPDRIQFVGRTGVQWALKTAPDL